jgi:heme/copper-type cytochrome/quinol oxidase subunit 1
VLPFFGIVSEIVPVFSRKPLFGYRAMVLSFVAIAGLSMAVWAHHMFTTGLVFLPFFSVASFAIAVPTGIKIFNWIATMWRGQLSFPTPMLFALGLIYIFVIGGISGVIVASPPLDFHLHDTYYVVGHLHNVLIGGTVYALFAGIYFWFPKATGRRLSERLGRIHFATWIVGFTLTFLPQYQLGASGMPRRYADYAADAGWTELNLLSTAGSLVLAVGMVPFLLAIVDALRRPPDQPDDPWGGNSLEWWTSSPPPHHNFRTLPAITSERPVHDARVAAARGARPATEAPPAGLRPMSMPEEVRFFGRSAVFGLVVAAVYWFLSYETAGTVLLLGFGLASLLGAFWLGRQASRRHGIDEPPWRWIALPSAEREALFPETAERLPGRTVAPLAVGLGLSLAALALIYGGWLLLAGLVPVLAGAWTWIGTVMAEWRAGDSQA